MATYQGKVNLPRFQSTDTLSGIVQSVSFLFSKLEFTVDRLSFVSVSSDENNSSVFFCLAMKLNPLISEWWQFSQESASWDCFHQKVNFIPNTTKTDEFFHYQACVLPDSVMPEKTTSVVKKCNPCIVILHPETKTPNSKSGQMLHLNVCSHSKAFVKDSWWLSTLK